MIPCLWSLLFGGQRSDICWTSIVLLLESVCPKTCWNRVRQTGTCRGKAPPSCYARPFCRLKAPLGLSLFRFAPQTRIYTRYLSRFIVISTKWNTSKIIKKTETIIIPAPSLIKSIIPPRQKSIAHVLIRFPVTLHIFSLWKGESRRGKRGCAEGCWKCGKPC